MSVAARKQKREYRLKMYRQQKGLCFFCAKPMRPPYLNPKKQHEKPTADLCVLFKLNDAFTRIPGQYNKHVASCTKCSRLVSIAAERRQPVEELRRRANAYPLVGPGHEVMP